MDLIEIMIPSIVESGINWVKEQVGSSKKEMRIKISDLENSVQELTYGNQELIAQNSRIMDLILAELQSTKKTPQQALYST